MKKKRWLGLLLVVALLCTVMVVQLTGASSLNTLSFVVPEENPFNPDYHLKTAKRYVNGELNMISTYDNTYNNDGSVSIIKTTSSPSTGESASATYLKKYDDQGRLITVSIKSDSYPDLYRYYTFNYNKVKDGYKLYEYSNILGNRVKTYDPSLDGVYSDDVDYEYGEDGRISDILSPYYLEKYTYEEDAQGRVVKKNYSAYSRDDMDSLLRTGTIEVTYNENGRTEIEKYISYNNILIYKYTYNKNNQLTGLSTHYYEDGQTTEASMITDLTFKYDDNGNRIEQKSSQFYAGDDTPSTSRVEYTYEYHPINKIPAEVSGIQKYWAEYSAQTSLNNGDRINVEMTEPNAGSIKSAAEVLEYDDGTQYYLNEIEESLDASQDQVFSLNFTGEDTDVIDESNPAPAQSIYIYDDNTFSNDHLVASIDNGKMSLIDKTEEDIVEPANAGGAGKLMMALPLQVKATVTPGTNVSVNVPAGTLEENKTYYFVLSSDMVVNDKISKSTNTDIVFKFNTGKVEPEHVHKAADPVKENEVAATCTKEGSYDEVVYCSECNEELSRETKTVAKLPHTEEVIKGKAATCTEKGLTDGKKCSVCDEILKAQEEIPALGHDYKDGVCTRCGDKDPNYQPEVPDEPEEPATSPKLPFFVNGIVKGLDGKWAMYKKGEVDTSYTGIAHNLFGWWRVKDGYVDFDANGIYKNEFGWWKTTKGKVTFLENGVFQNEYGWWRVENSKVNFKANGIYKNEHGWWKTTNGKVTFDENGVFKNQFGWWYVKDSKVDFNFTGIASNQYGTWYIKNGKVDFTKNGKVDFDGKTYQVTFGKAKLA